MPSQANQPLPEGTQLENYRILRVLATGGFSFVYLAHDENDKPVAVKEYLPSTLAVRVNGDAHPRIPDADLAKFRYGMKCFFEEGRALAGLQHPNVVRVLNFFRANETVYLVMRYERGRTLQDHIRSRRGAIEEDWLRKTFTQLLNGLREVHSNKLLHLDIKPGNVYVRNDGTPLLIDFGAARQTLSAEGITLPPSTRSARRCMPASPRRRRSPPTSAWRRTWWCRRGAPGRASTRPTCSTSSTGACAWTTWSGRRACSPCRRPSPARSSPTAAARRRSSTACAAC
jgi:serine/threonine protein kinase